MPDILLFDWRLDRAIEHELPGTIRPVYVPRLPLQVSVGVPPPAFQLLQKDPLLHQILVDECKAAFKASLGTIVQHLQNMDQKSKVNPDFYMFVDARRQALRAVETEVETARRRAEQAITRRWITVQQQKLEYKQYRFEAVVKVGKGVGGVVSGFVGVAGAAATGGASFAISIIGTYRALVDGFNAVRQCWWDASQLQKRVQAGLKSLQATYATGVKQGMAREVAASAVNAILKLPVTMTNVKTLEDDNKLWRGKLTHFVFLAHGMAESLNGLLESCDKLELQLVAERTAAKTRESLKKLQAEVNKMLTEGCFFLSMGQRVQIHKLHQEAEEGLDVQDKLAKELEALKQGRSHGVEWFERIVSLAADTGLAAAGALASPPEKLKDYVGLGSDVFGALGAINEIAADESEKVKAFEETVKKKFRETVLRDKIVAPPTPAKAAKPH